MKCWGGNAYGQLGLGDEISRGAAPGEMGDNLPAVDLGTGRTAKAIAAGASHACAILDDGSVKCWGLNTFGELGLGDTARRGDGPGEMGDNLPAVDLGTGRTAKSVSLGAYQTCAVLDDSTVKCWGYNAWGQLGLGDTGSRGDGSGEMGDNLPRIDLGSGRTARVLASGGHHECAILDNWTVKCWGYNGDGKLGLGDTNNRGDAAGEMGDNLPSVALGAGRTAQRLVATYIGTCAELDDGSMKCWGANWTGMLGIGPSDTRGDGPGEMGDSLPSFNFGTGRTVRSLGSGFGYHFGCALLDNGSVKCWGGNSYGQLGIGRSNNTGDEAVDMGGQLQDIDLGTGVNVVQVAAGDTHTCALLDTGKVKCWGSNQYGTLGQGDTMRRDGRPSYMGDNLPTVDLGTGRTSIAIAAGAEYTCAILDNGTVKCWGDNSYGQLGLGDTIVRGDLPGQMGDALPAVALGAGRSAKVLACGYRHACAILDDGSLKCWGLNNFGQLGLGDTAARGDRAGQMGDALPAVDVGTGRRAIAVFPGYFSTCAILDDATLKCWGHNGYGQLGVGDTVNRGGRPGQMGDALPVVALGAGRTARAVGLGQYDACAVLDDDTVKCWGYNASGQLGYADTKSRGGAAGDMGDNLAVVSLGSFKRAMGIALGWTHACAVLTDGSMKCWGANNSGQLGLGDTEPRGGAPNQMGNSLPTVDLGGF